MFLISTILLSYSITGKQTSKFFDPIGQKVSWNDPEIDRSAHEEQHPTGCLAVLYPRVGHPRLL